MSQLHGAFSVEIDSEKVARLIANRVIELIADRLPADIYNRATDPDPGAGSQRGVVGFGDLTDNGLVEGER